jgi:uncharacterized protein
MERGNDVKKSKSKILHRRRFLKTFYWCLSIVGVLSGFFFSACALQRCVVFPRCFVKEQSFRAHRYPGMQRLWISTPQGKVEAWFVPARKLVGDESGATGSLATKTSGTVPKDKAKVIRKPAVIYAHGNAELIDHSGSVVRGYTRMGVHVMLCEYRGYGRSAGAPSQKRIVADFVKCKERLTDFLEVDPERVFYHGRSLGTGVVSGLARKRKPAALVMEAPFVSVAAMMAKYFIPRVFVLDPFDNLAVVKKFKGPVLLLHGNKDRVIPFSHSQKLHRAASESTLKEYPWGHNNFVYGAQYWNDVKVFLQRNKIL